MKDSKLLVFLILLVALVSCKHSNESVLSTKEVETVNLKAEEFVLNEMLLFPKGCCIRDSFIVVFEPKLKDGFLAVYSLNSGRLLRRYGKKGESPTDFHNPRFILDETLLNTSSELLIGDSDALYSLKIDSIVSDSSYIHHLQMKLPREIMPYNYILSVSDSTLVANTTSEKQLMYYKRLSKEKTLKNVYRRIDKLVGVDEFCCTTQIYDAYYAANKDNIIIAYKNWKQIDLVSLDGNLKKRICFDDYQHNIDKITVENKSNIRIGDDAILFFTYVFTTEDHFYALCWNDTKKNIKQGVAKSEIYKFDWKGNLLNILQLDKAVSYFCIDDKTGIIYAIGTEPDLDFRLYKYQELDFHKK